MWSGSGTRASSRVRLALSFLFALLLHGARAHAVLQPTPGGNTIPTLGAGVTACTDRNVEVCLDLNEGDATFIDARADALVSPEVFQPTCSLIFKPIVKGGGDHLAFGWYNLTPDPANAGKFLKPAQAELYGMFLFATGFMTGLELAGEAATLDLAAEAAAGRYKGGEIGFFLAGGPDFSTLELNATTHALTGMKLERVFYTQHALNPGSTGASTFYQVLTWQSVEFKNSFYFGWEDRTAGSDADNDFDDLVFLVGGIQCAGGGEACDTGKEGVCKDGTQQCSKGELVCVQNIQPGPEKCNALDDDCNGQVDDGDGLCEEGKVCDRGLCVPQCGTGEFRCDALLVCNDRGLCVEPACADKDCPVGQVCRAGNCIDGCMGVTCPYGEVCRNGGCVDPCAGITCDAGYSCVLGICSSCACSSCEGSQVCGDKNVCVDTGCESQTCMAGMHCAQGNCVDDCAGTQCPQGQKCEAGACVVDPTASVGGSSSTGGNGTAGEIMITPNPGNKAGSGGAGGRDPGLQGNDCCLGGQSGATGCGCNIPGSGGGPGLLFGLALLGAGALFRRRQQSA